MANKIKQKGIELLKAQERAKQKPDTRKELDEQLNKLEARLEELRVLYEQYFIDILPQTPDKLRAEAVRWIRQLLKAPFRNPAVRFRLRMLVHRYQTYSTYWERVLREREEGRYGRDIFKAELREKLLKEAEREVSRAGAAERGLKQLYNTYEEALKKAGAKVEKLNFASFKKSLMQKAKQLAAEKGVKKLHYKVVVKEGKVLIKASAKN